MSSKIDAREVLKHLNQLGYKNIDAPQLQAFIKDLKKLMKYEQRKCDDHETIKISILRALDEKENINYLTSDVNNLKFPTSQSSTAVELSNSIINSPVRRPNTEPTQHLRPKEKKNQILSLESTEHSIVACPVHFFQGVKCSETRSKSVGTACICPSDAYSQVSSSCMKDKDKSKKKGKRPVSSTSESKVDTNTTSSFPTSFDDKIFTRYCHTPKKSKKSVASRNPTHDFTHPCYCSDPLRPKSGVIKCNINPKPAFTKCDPVSLHKYYQRQWKLNKIPGEDMVREQKFRWCFREKISCGPPEYGGPNFRFLPKLRY